MKLFALGLLFSFNAFAANTPPGFDPVKWDKLINKIFENGEVSNIPAGELRFLTEITPKDGKDKGISHHADYISLLGHYSNRAQYIPLDISAVDEDWQTTDGRIWTIDQWTYHASVKGELLSVERVRMVQDDGRVLKWENLEVGPVTDMEQLNRWAAKLNQWIEATKDL